MYQINQNLIKTLQWHFQTSSFSIFTDFFLCRAVYSIYSKSEILAQFMLSYTHTHTQTILNLLWKHIKQHLFLFTLTLMQSHIILNGLNAIQLSSFFVSFRSSELIKHQFWVQKTLRCCFSASHLSGSGHHLQYFHYMENMCLYYKHCRTVCTILIIYLILCSLEERKSYNLERHEGE